MLANATTTIANFNMFFMFILYALSKAFGDSVALTFESEARGRRPF